MNYTELVENIVDQLLEADALLSRKKYTTGIMGDIFGALEKLGVKPPEELYVNPERLAQRKELVKTALKNPNKAEETLTGQQSKVSDLAKTMKQLPSAIETARKAFELTGNVKYRKEAEGYLKTLDQITTHLLGKSGAKTDPGLISQMMRGAAGVSLAVKDSTGYPGSSPSLGSVPVSTSDFQQGMHLDNPVAGETTITPENYLRPGVSGESKLLKKGGTIDSTGLGTTAEGHVLHREDALVNKGKGKDKVLVLKRDV